MSISHNTTTTQHQTRTITKKENSGLPDSNCRRYFLFLILFFLFSPAGAQVVEDDDDATDDEIVVLDNETGKEEIIDFPESMAYNLDSLLNGGLSLELDSSFFTLTLENGMPLSLTLSADLLDENGNVLTSLANNENISAAQISPMGIHNVYHATSTTKSTVRILLTDNQLQSFKSANSILLNFGLQSAEGKYVAIKRSDLLRIKAKILARVHASLDVEIGKTNK
jgi:hypothetical protein